MKLRRFVPKMVITWEENPKSVMTSNPSGGALCPLKIGYPALRLDAHRGYLYMSGPGALLHALLLHGCACLSRQTAGGACEGNVQVWTNLKGRNVAKARLGRTRRNGDYLPMVNTVQLIAGGTPGCMCELDLDASLWEAFSERVHPRLQTGGRHVVFCENRTQGGLECDRIH